MYEINMTKQLTTLSQIALLYTPPLPAEENTVRSLFNFCWSVDVTLKLLCILASLSIFYSGEPVHAQDDTSPQMTIREAIATAEQYAEQKEIDLRGKFIKKVEYHNTMNNNNDRPYWAVYWINKRVTKGGGVELRLYPDGSIEEKYYK